MRVAGGVAIAASLAVAPAMRQEPVSWTLARAVVAPVKPGAVFDVQVSAAIEDGWHIYAISQQAGGPIATTFTVPGSQPFTRGGAIRGPAVTRAMDPNFDMETEFHEGPATFHVPVRTAGGTRPGTHRLTIGVRFQACTADICLPPESRTLTLLVPVRTAAAGKHEEDI